MPVPSGSRTPGERVIRATVLRHAVAWGTTAVFFLFGARLLGDLSSSLHSGLLFLWLFAVILWSSFGAIGDADALGELLGEPLGSLVLALSIIIIEAFLIAAMVLGSAQGATAGRDTIFAAIMIVVNGVAGLALFLGGLKHREQDYNFQGALAYLAVIVPIASIGLILPRVTTADPAGSVTTLQAWGILLASVFLYGTFLLVQVGRHKGFFVEAGGAGKAGRAGSAGSAGEAAEGDRAGVGRQALLLVASILPIVLLAKQLSKLIDHGIEVLGAPPALGGVLIALLVISPKGITAVKAALANQPQKAINVGFGSAAPALGLTIPVVLAIGIVTGRTLIMGLVPAEAVLLGVTLLMAAITFAGPRTTVLEGAAHLVLFLIYVVLLFSP